MIDIGNKIDNDPSSAGKLTATEFNHIPTEIENAIKPFMNLDGNDSSQLYKAIISAGAKPIDTISDFREMEETPEKVFVYGYYSKDEKTFGSLVFRKISDGVDNGGTVIETVNAVYELQTNLNFVNVRWFGAKADNIADDTPAFKSAIATLKDVFADDGKYKITDTLELNYGQRLFGSKQNTYIYQYDGAVPLIKATGGLTGSFSAVSGITSFQNFCNVSSPDLFSKDRAVMLKSSINSLTSDAGSMQLGFQQNDSQIVPFTEYLKVRSIDGDKITFTEDTVFNLYPDTDSKLYNVSFTRVFIDNIHFIKKTHGTLIDLDYNENSVVENNIFSSGQYSGAIVWCEHSYKVDIKNNNSYLDASTIVRYGDVNPTAYDYYMFNTYKIVSSQQCNVLQNEINNGTQCIDITYTDAPSIMTTVRDNIMNSPRHNMATSHWGSFANIFDSNTGNYCQEGISTRSRNDVVINNVIMGSREAIQEAAEKETTSYGVYIGTGWTINGLVKDNVIHGFNYGVYATQSSYGGFAYQRIRIEDNEVRYCTYGIRVHRYDNDNIAKDELFDATIRGNTFKGNRRSILYVPYEFTNGIYFTNNIIIDAPIEDYAICYIKANCKNITVKDNIIPSLENSVNTYFLTHGGMTAEADGTDISADNQKNNYNYANLVMEGNTCKVKTVHNINTIYFNGIVAQLNLPIQSTGSDYFKFFDVDADLFVTSNVMNLSYDYDNNTEANIHNIYPTVDGMTVSVFGSSNIHFKDDGNIMLNGATSVDLGEGRMTKFTCYSDKWYIH